MMATRRLRADHRQDIGIQALLEWTFLIECAHVEFGSGALGAGYGRISNAGRMADRGALGCRIEGGGRSLPADDAEIVASFVGALPIGCGGRPMAMRVAELARAGRTEDAMADVTPRCVPVSVRQNQTGTWACTEHVCYVMDRSGRKPRRFNSRVCPVTYTPDAGQIGRARRNYLAWLLALADIRSRLISNGNLVQWRLNNSMPPLEPWKKVLDE